MGKVDSGKWKEKMSLKESDSTRPSNPEEEGKQEQKFP